MKTIAASFGVSVMAWIGAACGMAIGLQIGLAEWWVAGSAFVGSVAMVAFAFGCADK